MRRLAIAAVLLGTLVLAPPVASATRGPCSPPIVSVTGSNYGGLVVANFSGCGDGGAYNVYVKVVPETGTAAWFQENVGQVLTNSWSIAVDQFTAALSPGHWYIQLYVFQGSTQEAFAQYEFAK